MRSALWTTQSWKALSNRTALAWKKLSKTTSYRKRRSEELNSCFVSKKKCCFRWPSWLILHLCGCLWIRYLRPDDLGPKVLPVVKEEEEEDDGEEEEMETVVIEAPEEKWDCETIISEFHFHLNSLCCKVASRIQNEHTWIYVWQVYLFPWPVIQNVDFRQVAYSLIQVDLVYVALYHKFTSSGFTICTLYK